MEKNPTFMLVVAAALERSDGRWLMHQRPLSKAHGGQWEFPGGKVEPTELPREALIRELHEELDIRVEAGSLLPVGFAEEQRDGEGLRIVILLYTSRDWEGEPRAVEGEALGWFAPEEALKLDMPPLDIELARILFQKEAG